MVEAEHHHFPDQTAFRHIFRQLLKPERNFYWVILIYSVAISLLSLVLPVSVQLLIDTIANIGQPAAVFTIGLLMFGLLLLAGFLYCLRAWCMELCSRKIYVRFASEIALTGMQAKAGEFADTEKAALFNRYFDIMTLKKNVPYLLSHGFSLLFQSVVGFVVVSLYHFYFFVFSLLFLLLVYAVWSLLGWRSVSSAFLVSERKHQTASRLQALVQVLALAPSYESRVVWLERTNELLHGHLDAQRSHFHYSFTQQAAYFFIYALASAVLLSMGGWLVIQGQLTLGQLVAAELIFSSILYGLTQLAGYLDYYYDLCAAVEELSRFNRVACTLTVPAASVDEESPHA